MKKKTKDLTIEEVNNICQKLKCCNCPFNVESEDRCMTYREVLDMDEEVDLLDE